MRKIKSQPVVASDAKIAPFLEQLKSRRRSGRRRLIPIKLQQVVLRIEFGGMKQELTKDVIHGKSFIDDTLETFNGSKITATIDGKKYLSTTLGSYLAKKHLGERRTP